MNSLRAVTRRAALAAFLLFAAGLFVVGPADAARTTDARSSLAPLSEKTLASSSSRELTLLGPASLEPAESAPRLAFAEDLSLLDVEARPCGFELFGGVGTKQCALTYARNNPLKYVDPDGKAVVPANEFGLELHQKSAAFTAAKEHFASASGWRETVKAGWDVIRTSASLALHQASILPGPAAMEVAGARVVTLSHLGDVLKPGGMKIGEALRNTNQRGFVGTLDDAKKLFQSLVGNAVVGESGGAKVAQLDGGVTVVLRTASGTKGTSATVEIQNAQGLGIRNVKFFWSTEVLKAAQK